NGTAEALRDCETSAPSNGQCCGVLACKGFTGQACLYQAREKYHQSDGDEGLEVFFIPVRGMIPDHALPVQHPPIATDATAAGAGHFCVAPGPNTRLLVRGDIAHPQRAKGTPADLQTATAIVPMAEGA